MTNTGASPNHYFDCPEAQEALRVITTLREAGFVAYLAGGCVRDALLGRKPKDYDVATNATPESVREVFGRKRTLAFGASFGVIGVLPPLPKVRDSNEPTIEPTEVATFRSDGDYTDGRRPDSVHFGEAEQDALRRDFTINGLFFDPAENKVVDFVGGQDDIERGVLRTIGRAEARIDEDKLRMLRAVRFATSLGFSVDDATITAIRKHADEISVVSGERIGAEMRRILASEFADQGLQHLRSLALERVVLPELANADLDRFAKIHAAIETRGFVATLASLLITMPSPLERLPEITQRWKLSNEEVRQSTAAIKSFELLCDADQRPWCEVQPILIDRDIETSLVVASAIAMADGLSTAGVEVARDALAWPTEKLNPPFLLTGDDLREIGVPPGPQYRTILEQIRDAQLNEKIASREEAIQLVKTL